MLNMASIYLPIEPWIEWSVKMQRHLSVSSPWLELVKRLNG